jgi:hypothetical protein
MKDYLDRVTSQQPTTLFEDGDIFLVENTEPAAAPSASFIMNWIKYTFDSNQKSLEGTAAVIQWMQRILGHQNARFTHAGIAFSDGTIIEMNARGITRTTVTQELQGKSIIKFHCTNNAVRELVRDLAINYEGSALTEQYPQLDTHKPKIKYDNLRGARALLSGTKMTEDKLTAMNDQINSWTQSLDISSRLFCSQMVILIYQMAYKFYQVPNALEIPAESTPSSLYAELMKRSEEFIATKLIVEPPEATKSDSLSDRDSPSPGFS